MKFEALNLPKINFSDLSHFLSWPSFADLRPDFGLLGQLAVKYRDKTSILVIGHGGSINPFRAIYSSLNTNKIKPVHFLDTVDPDKIADLRSRLFPETTLVIAVSKSGTTATVLEMAQQFSDYETIAITNKEGSLAEFCHQNNFEVYAHAQVSGRFSGLTETSLIPACISGIDISELVAGAGDVYSQAKQLIVSNAQPDFNNAKNFNVAEYAWLAAVSCFDLETRLNYSEIYLPIYSSKLYGFAQIITQLVHESFCKNGLGLTVVTFHGPESQHHSNQRFFGGRKNMLGWFCGVESFDSTDEANLPQGFDSFNKLSKSIQIELIASLAHAKDVKIPTLVSLVDKINSRSVGQFLAFWHLFAFYSANLRRVNPFDQPEVEFSKQASLKLRPI